LRAFVEHFPLIPVEEEGRLCDAPLREILSSESFAIAAIRICFRERVHEAGGGTFHTIHKYLLLAHSAQHYQFLGRLVGQAERHRPKELVLKYGELFMKALAVKATVRKHVNVLQHILGYFKTQLGAPEKAELLGVISDYHQGLTPLIVPLTLIKHYVHLFDVGYIREQVYLNPHPKELMLRNHV
jgi:uncharacterized protein YbgA (DUF1722 family)